MKKYSIEEIIKMWREGNRPTFKCHMCGVIVLKDEGIEFKFAGGYVPFESSIMKQEWELIQQPIPFMEAVKAYSEGKGVEIEKDGIRRDWHGIIHLPSIKRTKWYIKEDSNE